MEVCIDVVDPAPVASFWCAFLGYRTTDPTDGGWVHLEPPNDSTPVINLQRVPESKTIKNRLHFDLFVHDPEPWVASAVALGATQVRLHDAADDWFQVMQDPAGNEFCIYLERN